MRRRDLLALGCGYGAASFLPLIARAQQRLPRIGYLSVQLAAAPSANVAAFQQGLGALGYVDGGNVAIDYRFADYRLERLPALAQGLLERAPTLIAALEPPAALAAANATRRTPIVMRSAADPVAEGLIKSLAHPGGNITGLTSESSDLNGKRLELLQQLRPGLVRAAVMWNEAVATAQAQLDAMALAGRALGVGVIPIEAATADGLDAAVLAAAQAGAQGLIVIRSPMFVENRHRIAALAVAHGLAAIADERDFTASGFLASYGARLEDLYRRAASFVDKILKGTSPEDLPVEQPTMFDLIVNPRTAAALGLTIPPSLLVRADEVIE